MDGWGGKGREGICLFAWLVFCEGKGKRKMWGDGKSCAIDSTYTGKVR